MIDSEKIITVSLPCPNCLTGVMEYTGIDYPTKPKTHKHVCELCGYISKYPKKYPYTK